MLIVSELSEALEADRKGQWVNDGCDISTYDKETKKLIVACQDIKPEEITAGQYKNLIQGRVEEELADAIIRICGLAGTYKIDLDWHVVAKMAYNETRPFKHGKNYG
jgi:hypothetical protein